MALPAFHTMGIIVQLLIGHFAMQPIGLYPPTATTPNSLPMMATPANLLDHIIRTKSTGLATIPAFLQVWAQDKDAVRVLASLQYVVSSYAFYPFDLIPYYVWSGLLWRVGTIQVRHLYERVWSLLAACVWSHGVWGTELLFPPAS